MQTLKIGEHYYVRTNNDHYVGELTAILGPYTLALKNASWVAQSGRLAEFCAKGKTSDMEIEPVGTIPAIHYQVVIHWPHQLFTKAVPE